MIRYSYTKLSTFRYCPRLFDLRYIQGVKCYPEPENADDPRAIGRALHLGISQGVDAALEFYRGLYPLETNEMVNEEIKLSILIPKVQALLGKRDRVFEYHFSVGGSVMRHDPLDVEDYIFEGFIDVVLKKEDGTYAIYDFKYSFSDDYAGTGQINLYKDAFERSNPGKVVSEFGYILIPKTQIRQRKDESVEQFRCRLIEKCNSLEPKLQLLYPFEEALKDTTEEMLSVFSQPEYPKTTDKRACDFCEFKDFCSNGVTYMILPPPVKRQIRPTERIKLFIYGKPVSGKTFFANQFPDAIFLNTDGNINSFDSPYIHIGDTVKDQTMYSGWLTFKDAVSSLADFNQSNAYKTIVVDLVEDVYELCRKYWCNKLGIIHESKNSFVAWDASRQDFLSVCNQLAGLPQNIIFISHQDDSRDLIKQNGDSVSLIKPALTDKLANKIAGMVDITARLVNNGKGPMLEIPNVTSVFGGSRIRLKANTIPATYSALIQLINDSSVVLA